MVWGQLITALHATPTKLGDLDSDGVFTVLDLAKLVGHSSGAAPLIETLTPFADLNQDSFINDADQTELVNLILGTSTPQDLPLDMIREVSPATGETNVAVTRETVLHFAIPLALNAAIDTTKLYAEFGGRKILSRAAISSDRKKVTIFYLEPLPSNARVKVTFDSTGVNDLIGRPVDGDGDGQPAGTFTTTFDTITITAVAGTAVSGRIFASERATGGTEVPLAGVTITVDGAEETLRAVTDAQGNFTLNPSPAGTFFVHIDGRTSPQSSYPNGNYYPSVGKKWYAIAGRTDNLSGDIDDSSTGGTGTIYLPNIKVGTLNGVSQTQDTTIVLPAAIANDHPEWAGLRLDVPANSMFADDGTRGGKVGVAPVAPDRIPSPLPPGLNLPLVITIQTDGATNFDRPVPVCFPNLPDPVTGKKLAPGEKSALWSFNHDTGEWEIIGPMTVTEDGMFVKTDAGVGVKQPGWHGTIPASNGTGESPGSAPPPPPVPCTNLSPWEYATLAYDFAKLAANCAAEFSKIKNAINCGTELADLIPKWLRRANDLSDSAKNGTITLETAEQIIASIRNEMSSAVALRDCFETASPSSKAKASVQCALGVLAYAEQLCGQIKQIPPGSPCSPGKTITTVCEGLPTVNRILYDANALVAISENLEKNAALGLTDLILKRIEEALRAIRSRTNNGAKVGLARSSVTTSGTQLNPDDITLLSEMLGDLNSELETVGLATTSSIEMIKGMGSAQSSLDRSQADAGAGLKALSIPMTGSFYYRVEYGSNVQRGRTSSSGRVSLVFSAGERYTFQLYDPQKKLIGSSNGSTGDVGSNFSLNYVALSTTTGLPDADGDGLPNEVEDIIGTNPANSDSDGDGILDGAELEQGTNPLNGFITQTGIIASVPTSSPATDVCALNNLAVTANGGNGISVFNVLSGLNPTRIADVDTPGTAVAVASTGNFVAVADYQSGLAIIDLSDPAAIHMSHQLPLGAAVQAVAVSGPVAYAGTTLGQIVAVDLASGIELARASLAGGAGVQDLAVWRDTLYALQVGKLTALDLETLVPSGSLNLSGGVGAGGRRLRLFAGDGTLYAAHTSGFNIVDTLANPNAPTLVQNFNTSQFGWKQIVANGSGLGIAATSPNSTNDGPHDIDLYTLGSNQRTPAFATTFVTPGLAAAVSLYNGLAYVADSEAGLQVVSYKPYDNLGVAPTIGLTSNFALNQTTKTGTAEEGKLMRLSAAVADDVQVRNVEFYVNGTLALTDGNYPFEHRFTTPALAAGSPTFKIKAKATDTGGNVAWSDEYTVTLVLDATPPQVRSVWPPNNALFGSLTSLYASFNEPMDTASLTGTGFKLMEAGPDKLLGTADDVLSTGTFSYRESVKSVFMDFAGSGLAPGLYQITVQNPAGDVAGNKLVTPFTSSFRIYNAGLDTDGDGVPDEYEPLLGLNPTKADTNNNGVPDGLEDYDNDGLKNAAEFYMHTDPRIADTNGNGISDGNEDEDMDGLKDQAEFLAGTDPFNIDTDGDGLDDASEVADGTDPKVKTGHRYNLASAATSYLNAAQETPPVSVLKSATSPAVSMLNAWQDNVPSQFAQSAASSTVSFLNAAQEVLPPSVQSAATSPSVSFLNAIQQALPATVQKDAASPVVIYRKN